MDSSKLFIKVCSFSSFFFPLFVCFWLHHTTWGNLSSPTSDQTCALCIGSVESWLLHHQGSPKVCLFFCHFFALDPKLRPWWWLSSFSPPTVEEALVEDAWTNGKSGQGYCLNLMAYCHMPYKHQKKKIELIFIIILAASLDSMIKFKIYFSGFQEN